MRVPDAKLAEVFDQGFTIVEGFLDKQTLADAQAAMFEIYPRPETYFADPHAYRHLTRTQFSGITLFPYADWALNRLPVYPDLVDAAERLLSTKDLEIYKVELWAKYAGAIDYEQAHHRDYGNHTLVVPRADGVHTQMTTFILLLDVTEADGPTKIVPRRHTADLPLVPNHLPMGDFFDKETSVTGPAGSLMIYKTDTLHRGSGFKGADRSRFALLTDFQARGWRWNGKLTWANQAGQPGMTEAMVRMTPRERDLFGWPPAGSDYWNEQTLRDVAARYPGMDMTPYRPA